MYKDFRQLSKNEKNGIDYRITAKERKGTVLIVAPHGGLIEICTSETASSIADDFFSLYLFEGIKARNNYFLHIRSTSFNEPVLEKLLKKNKIVLTIHGLREESEVIYIGGRNHSLRNKLIDNLNCIGFSVVCDNTKSHSGTDIQNICNRNVGKKGVQFEIGKKLRRRFIDDCEYLQKFSKIVRDTILEVI